MKCATFLAFHFGPEFGKYILPALPAGFDLPHDAKLFPFRTPRPQTRKNLSSAVFVPRCNPKLRPFKSGRTRPQEKNGSTWSHSDFSALVVMWQWICEFSLGLAARYCSAFVCIIKFLSRTYKSTTIVPPHELQGVGPNYLTALRLQI